MKAIRIIEAVGGKVAIDQTKVHLATWNGADNPLDVYLAGNFQEWQRWQTKRNFEQKYVLSLIKLPGNDRWLFAGLYESKGHEEKAWQDGKSLFYYDLTALDDYAELDGRLVVRFKRSGRQSYLHAERWIDQMDVEEIMAEKLSIAEFPGFRKVDISKGELELIVNQSLESWRVALSNVAGVYLISDTESGQLYVGSATGAGGIWQRWCTYAANGHGGNTEIVALLQERGADHARNFRYSILELADLHDSQDEVSSRESHWKRILLTRGHGLNAN
ncbi:GIY-YIG nuclease family protein [Accumulibacter sp.]|uniref:GIY-YIG nuclease family protein n=1 Tax=Accumulibacter sp. TaxID=2053492 RepID=UPI0025E2ED98|nr:GIY-YIG nuclease family protein [Accumulibacter sp.]MCP5230242.1 GIY-YIG nuclease family protein [Accumulibacter sp.]